MSLCFERVQGAEGQQRTHHGDCDAEVFASEQLSRDKEKEVTIENVVGPFSCLLVGFFSLTPFPRSLPLRTVHRRKGKCS